MDSEFDYWGEDGDHAVADWQREVAEGDTRAGYREWVEGRRELVE